MVRGPHGDGTSRSLRVRGVEASETRVIALRKAYGDEQELIVGRSKGLRLITVKGP